MLDEKIINVMAVIRMQLEKGGNKPDLQTQRCTSTALFKLLGFFLSEFLVTQIKHIKIQPDYLAA